MRLPVLKSFFNDDLFRADDFDFLFPKTNNCLIDLKEGDKELELTAAIPGIDKKDISIEER